METTRLIGVRHRVKKTAEGEARPTQVFTRDCKNQEAVYDLPDDNSELDFVLDRFPTEWRGITDEDDLTSYPSHHVKWRKLKKEEDPASYPEHLLRKEGKTFFLATKVPVTYDGLQVGDQVAMILGGSGDRLAFALANRGKKIGAEVQRIPTFVFKNERDGRGLEKEEDAKTLVEVFSSNPELFYFVRSRDRKLIAVREALQVRIDAMKARIACEQRLRQCFIGKVFLSEEGHFPEGSIEEDFDKCRASDTILSNLLREEKEAENLLVGACKKLDVYEKLFDPIEGVGPMIASRIISAVCDIRMFKTPAKLKAFMGVHVLSDGRFPRRRTGEVANWHPDARQALFLLADQFNRRPNSVWGKKLLEYKAKSRAKHPEPIVGENGKKRYTDGHIHKMALWRTVTKFTEWLWREWWKMEKNQAESETEAA